MEEITLKYKNLIMKHLFIPYNLAALAKDKGFDEDCIGQYNGTNIILRLGDFDHGWCFEENLELLNNTMLSMSSRDISAPLYQQIIDWFREKHNYLIWVERDEPREYYYKIDIGRGTHESGYHDDYYKALNDGIEEAFKLI